MRLLSCAFVAAFAAPSLTGQIYVDPNSEMGKVLPERFESFWNDTKAPRLACKVDRYNPRLSFTFRFWSGFQTIIDGKQLVGAGNRMILFFRVKPTDDPAAKPSYFFQELALPEVPPNNKTDVWMSGGYYVGSGKYSIEWLLSDHQGRVCRQSWRISTPRTNAKLTLPANSAAPLGLERWPGLAGKDAAGGRVTVLMHAAPLYRRRYLAKLSPYDRSVLLSSLISILDQTRFKSARVIVFDTLGRRILFRSDNFDSRSYFRLFRTLETAEYGTISAKTLADGPTEPQLIADLVRQETMGQPRSDAIIFLGPELRYGAYSRLTPELTELKQGLPPSYYFAFPVYTPVPDDLIAKLIKGKGKTLTLMWPEDLAGAIRQVNDRVRTGG